MQKQSFLLLLLCQLLAVNGGSQDSEAKQEQTADGKSKGVNNQVYYGTASYYADMFNGRPTANGEIYSHEKYTAACNVLPLGTWIRVTNMRNKRSVIVKTNDRLHIRMKRIVDLSKVAAEKLGYISRGLTQVRVEVLEKRSIKVNKE